mmetsp:Transcript_47925/g.119904  ORF Transcript_47925/g.119904 Transcript_47925/m.119904 type:complete len:237 (-) Transcript_47925:1538-2248(-)
MSSRPLPPPLPPSLEIYLRSHLRHCVRSLHADVGVDVCEGRRAGSAAAQPLGGHLRGGVEPASRGAQVHGARRSAGRRCGCEVCVHLHVEWAGGAGQGGAALGSAEETADVVLGSYVVWLDDRTRSVRHLRGHPLPAAHRPHRPHLRHAHAHAHAESAAMLLLLLSGAGGLVGVDELLARRGGRHLREVAVGRHVQRGHGRLRDERNAVVGTVAHTHVGSPGDEGWADARVLGWHE